MILWLAIAGLAVAAIVLVVNHDAGTVLGLESDTFANLVWLTALMAVIAAGLFRRGTFSSSVKAAGVWVLIAAGLVVAYTFRHDAERLVYRVAGEMVPGYAIPAGEGSVAVVRAGNGHFAVEALVNDAPVRLMLDTGASLVVLTTEDAQRAGIDLSSLAYTLPVWTANGPTSSAPVTLDRIEIGSITVDRVRAAVARPGMLRESLLGMSFLERIPSWRVERDRLILGG